MLWRLVDLLDRPPARKPARKLDHRSEPQQLALSLDESITEALPGLPAFSPLEEIEAELDISGIDSRRHVMELYRPLLAELECVPATKLARCRNDSVVWVAGVKVASQTPAIRSGQRIIFLTIDDVTGPIDVTVFERVQPRCARTVFHSWLQLVRGRVRKRGGASYRYETDAHNVGLTVVALEVFDLAEVAQDRKHGHSLAAAIGRQRKKQIVAGLPAAVPEFQPPGRLWHSSGGSAGR